MNMTDVQWVSPHVIPESADGDADLQSAGISLFYAGYMITQVPGALLLSKYKPRIVIPLMM